MKIKNLIGGFLLASCLGLGVAAGISAHESKGVEEAKADTVYFTKGQDLYFDPGVWDTAGAAFIAHFFNKKDDTTGATADLWITYNNDSDWYKTAYHVAVPDEYRNVVFCRMAPNWDSDGGWHIYDRKVWNQTDDIDAGSWDKCSITGWDKSNHSESNQTASAFHTWVVAHSDQKDGTWTSTTNISLSDFQNNDKGGQIYNTTVTLEAGMQFKIHNTTKDWWIGTGGIEDGGAINDYYMSKNTDKEGESNVTVLKDGVYEVYIKLQYQLVWIQLSSTAQADIYADEFLGLITCTDESTTFAKNVWNKVGEATTSAEAKYQALDKGARDLLTGATFTVSVAGGVTTVTPTGTTTQKVANAVARYDRVLAKYGYGTGADDYHDFMGREPASLSANPFVRLTTEETVSYTGIAILVVLSVASISAYFLLKKKKHN